jgi:hypothetical protein
MIALDLYVGENSLANHLSSRKGSACTKRVQMSLHLVPDVNLPQHVLQSLRGAGRGARANAHSPAMGLMRDGWE